MIALTSLSSSIHIVLYRMYGIDFNILNQIMMQIDISALIAIPAISVALLLPIVLLLLNRENQAYAFDNKIILEQVFRYKTFVFLLLLTSALLCFHCNTIVKTVIIVNEALLIYLDFQIAERTYKWFCVNDKNGKKTFRQAMRLKYLDSLEDPNEIYEAWQSVFSGKFKNKNHIGLIESYIRSFSKLNSSKYGKIDYIRNASFINLLIKNLPNIKYNDFEQYRLLVSFSLSFARSEASDSARSEADLSMCRNQRELFVAMLKLVLKYPENYFRYAFFSEVDKTAKRMSIETLYWFSRRTFPVFLGMLEECDYSLDKIWNISPLETLIITEADFTTEDGMARKKGALDGYIDYISSKINSRKPGENNKQVIDGVTELIFRDIDLPLWMDILTYFLAGGYAIDENGAAVSRIIDWCKRRKKRHYGLYSRNYAISVSYNKEEIEEKNIINVNQIYQQHRRQIFERTIKLLKRIFPQYITLDEMKKALAAAEEAREKNKYEKYFSYLDLCIFEMKNTCEFLDEEDKKKGVRNTQ